MVSRCFIPIKESTDANPSNPHSDGRHGTALAVAAGPSVAKDGDGARVIKRGDCSGASTFKLKAKPDNGRLEVEFEGDQR